MNGVSASISPQPKRGEPQSAQNPRSNRPPAVLGVEYQRGVPCSSLKAVPGIPMTEEYGAPVARWQSRQCMKHRQRLSVAFVANRAAGTAAGKGNRHSLSVQNSAQDFKALASLILRSAFSREAQRLAREIQDQNQGPRNDQSQVA